MSHRISPSAGRSSTVVVAVCIRGSSAGTAGMAICSEAASNENTCSLKAPVHYSLKLLFGKENSFG